METKRVSARNNLWVYHIFALFAVTAWGLSFISTRVLLDSGLHPIEIYIYRSAIAYVALRNMSQTHSPTVSRTSLLFVLCGIVAGSVYFISENIALQYTLVSNVSLITSIPPLLTVLLVGAVYKTDRPGRGAYIGSVVAFIGVGLVIFNSAFNMSINPLGDFLALLSAFCWAIYGLLLKPLNAHYDAQFITRKVFFYGILTALPFLTVEPEIAPISILFNANVLYNLLFLSLICSLGAFLVWAITVIKARSRQGLQLSVFPAGGHSYLLDAHTPRAGDDNRRHRMCPHPPRRVALGLSATPPVEKIMI